MNMKTETLEYKDNPFTTAMLGIDLKDWVWYHKHHKTKYTKLVNGLISIFNADDNKKYILKRCGEQTQVIEVPEKGRYNNVPCNN